ncbi:uncharacterized protein LOC129566022 [Sitodiplosis mosellana]|uniref:uncharacterized protein LOC129566022 n=1 Tax=Sitodiplosis mosellana TaxID=263140 RepID=UPI002443880E|nr:uncharacterized protein LOC129566022 [Sitodiplosis mosellana]XP_055297486.1 uncharacterized protein LOC129566022 [Sitodiplosis mosellana]
MNSRILEHLRGRPIAPIVNASSEKSDTKALKMMCILDYELDVSGLYPQIETIPKLKTQLLKIHSFASFKYFRYNLAKEAIINDKVLKCKHCELIASYLLMLEHMAISHNFHASAKMCMWCEKHELQDHIMSNSLDACYTSYLSKHRFSSTQFPAVIVRFYDLLRKVARTLRIETHRTKDFKCARVDNEETIPLDRIDDSMDSKIIVSKPFKWKYKETDERFMEKLFQTAMAYFHEQKVGEYTCTTTPDMNATSTTQSTAYSFSSTVSRRSSVSSRMNIGVDSIKFAIPSPSTRYDSPKSLSPFDMPSSTSQLAPIPPLSLSPPPLVTQLPSLPMFDMPLQELGFANFISSVLNSFHDDRLKMRAELEIKQIIYKYSAEDVAKQMTNNSQDSESDD